MTTANNTNNPAQQTGGSGGKSGKGLAVFIILLPLLVVIVSSLMYFNNWLTPEGRVNHGLLINPVLPVEALVSQPSEIQMLKSLAINQWQLILRVEGSCNSDCELWVQNLRQLHVALGKFESRVSRLYLSDTEAPAKVEEVGYYRTIVAPLTDLSKLVGTNGIGPTSIFIADPLGNMMLYFDQTALPKDIIKDLKKMLKLSSIG